ncbi:MAG TPA: SurA N-terminal domain-containing protein [Caulobacteraceae bacterium]
MTGSLRPAAKNPLGIALMGLLMLVFLLLGVGGGGKFPDAFGAAHTDAVVLAGSHSISARDFKRIFDQQKERLDQQAQQQVPMELLLQNGFDQQLLNGLAQDQAEAELLSRSGIAPAPALIDAEIRKLPFAFDRVTGKFSEQQFTQFLASQGISPRQAQAEITDEIAQNQFAGALAAGFRAPRIYAALSALKGLENRDVSYFMLTPASVPQPAPPTDPQLLAFMKAHAAQLTLPEMRVITLVRFSASALAPSIVLDPAEVQKAFDFKKDSLSTPETRSLVEIPVKTAAQGAQAAARLAKGEDPAAVASSLGAEPIAYADKPQSAIADAKLAAAVFAMKPGQSAGPIQGDLGMAAVKVLKVTPGAIATLATAKPKIEADLRTKKAQDRAYALSQTFDDARQAGANIAAAAQKAGVAVTQIGPVTAKGLDEDGKTNPLLNDKILKSAFDRAAGEDVDIEDAGPGEYFALHVDRAIPPALPALDKKRAELTAAYMRQRFIEALTARADGLMAAMREGGGIEQAAAQVGGHVTHQLGMQRVRAQQFKDLGRDFLEGIFAAKPGDVFDAPGQTGVFIAKLDAVRPGDVTQMARVVQGIGSRVSEDYLRDLVEASKSAAQQKIKVTVNLRQAREALGVDPALLAKLGGKAPGAAK